MLRAILDDAYCYLIGFWFKYLKWDFSSCLEGIYVNWKVAAEYQHTIMSCRCFGGSRFHSKKSAEREAPQGIDGEEFNDFLNWILHDMLLKLMKTEILLIVPW